MIHSLKSTSILLGATLLIGAGTVQSNELRSSPVKTHPSQGDVSVVSQANAHLQADKKGIFVAMNTSGLTPGHVHTLWLVTINDPNACETSPCTSKDVLKRTDAVKADVGYAGGIIVDANGNGNFAAYQPVGPLNGAWFKDGLQHTTDVEVHLVVNDHGPAIDGQVADMLATYRGGCTNESIPAPMPASARAQGIPGPNQCRLVQFSIFEPGGHQS
jgi:hypothetical protein